MSTLTKVIRAMMLIASMLFLYTYAGYAQHEGHQLPATVPAAAIELAGTVVCADGPALPGAIVQLVKTTNGKDQLHASALSDQGGRFRLRAPVGNYMLRISFLGHANIAQAVAVEPGARLLNLGSVKMEIAAVEMEAVVAAADQDRVRLQAGYAVFDAARSSTAAGGSVADVLQTVPNLELDSDGRLMLRGSNSVLVLINGRRTVLKDEALVAFLKQMPASTLQKVEVSTTASAKQDAEGFAGLVNLEFTQGASAGGESRYSFAGSAATAGQFMASASAAGTKGKVAWDVAYAASTLRPQTYSHTMRDNFLAPDAQRTSHQESNADATHLLHTITAGTTAQVSSRNSLGGHAGYSWMRGTFDNVTTFADIAASGVRRGDAVITSQLQHTIPTADVSIRWSYHNPESAHLRWSSDLRYAGGEERFTGRYQSESATEILATDMVYQRRELVWQNDLEFDLAGTRLEVGHKTQLRSLDADFSAARLGIINRERLNLEETVTGLYASLSSVLGAVFVQGGLRAEAAATRLTLTERSGKDVHDVRWFPSLAAHWPHERQSTTQYQLAFGRRIQRPDAASLNPFAMGEDDMNSFIGNPVLEPEITDQVELAVVRRFNAMTVQATPYLRMTYDPVRPIKTVTASGQATTTLQNLDRSRAAGIDMSVNTRLHDRVTALLSSNVFYGETVAGALHAEGLYFSARASIDYKVASNTTAQFYAYRRSAQPIEQGEILSAVNSDVAVTHRFGNERRGSLTLRVSDPFNTNELAFHLADPTFTQHSERKVTSRMLSVFLSWSLGGAPAAEDARRTEEPPPRIF